MVAPVRDVYRTLKTILVGMRITLQYCFARTITVQYPESPPTLQPRYRGFHFYEVERCSACKACARACPVDCITVENAGVRKLDKATGIARGGIMTRYAIDYSKCMFCGLCTEPCPTQCIHMGDLQDLSGLDRAGTIVEFTELAKQGLRTPMPLWMQKEDLPAWAQAKKESWLARTAGKKEEMLKAVTPSPASGPDRPLTCVASAKQVPGPAAEKPAAAAAPAVQDPVGKEAQN